MTKLYDVILADPPWTFSVWNAEKSDRHASHKYNLMSVEDICAMPIANVITENCTLFLWATWPNLKDAFTVITAWGFTYRTVAWVWVKLNENSMGTHIGMGYYTRSNTEPSLLAVRGTMPVATHNVQALIMSSIRDHSRKPDEQYAKIERLYPNMNYLELFARYHRPRWDVYGDQIEGSITLSAPK